MVLSGENQLSVEELSGNSGCGETGSVTDKERLYIATIAHRGSITSAAEQLFIAQPSLTQALHRIEAEYGVLFFHRSRDGLRLTEAGQAYLDATGEMRQIYQHMENKISDVSGKRQGKINLGITSFQGGILLPEFLERYHKSFPLVELILLERTSTQLEQMAAEGRVDIIVMHSPFRVDNLNYVPLYRENFLLAVSPEDPAYRTACAEKKKYPLATPELLARQRFTMLNVNQRIRQVADQICAAAGIVPKVNFFTSSFVTALSLAAKGLGATFVPISYASYYAHKYRPAYFRLPPEWEGQWELVAAYTENTILSQPCLELIRVLKESIDSMPKVFK